MRSAAASAALLGGLLAVTVGVEPASATPPQCVYVATPGPSGDVSNLRCARLGGGYGLAPATWELDASTLVDPAGAVIGEYTGGWQPEDGAQPTFSYMFDPAQVSFDDFKAELMRRFGFTWVIDFGGWSGSSGEVVWADFRPPPSKAKH